MTIAVNGLHSGPQREFTDGETEMMSDWQPYPPPVRVPHTNGFAVAALVCGIGGIFVFPVSIAAIVLGHIARREARQTGEAGSGMATAGLVLGYAGIVIGILLIVAFTLASALFANWN